VINLKNQRAVIVGGTSGIGLAVARAAVEAGAEVVIASSRPARVEAALDQLGERATGRALDVLDPGDVTAFFAAAGPVDHVVYTAGGPLSMMTVAELDLDQARGFFDVRYFGALNVIRAAAGRLRGNASITLTSGTAGQRPGAGWALGASVCGAINSLTRTMAVELAPVRVNAVAPGVLRSAVWSRFDDADREAMYAQLGRSLPLGRVGEVADAAEAYLYCMTQAYTTGTVVTVDGGTLLV
jgi:NAD(P)-dependent dehydrogenase (short-subunit alcohol dehydrogenase family)